VPLVAELRLELDFDLDLVGDAGDLNAPFPLLLELLLLLAGFWNLDIQSGVPSKCAGPLPLLIMLSCIS